jgi:methylated-DNA-[protein]-cysteine S-methyltransferase
MWTEMESPVGPLRLMEREGCLRTIDFAPFPQRASDVASLRDDAHPLLLEAVRQLSAYFAGQRRDFDLPLGPEGSAFQQQVWRALQEIPYGVTASYGELARRLGRTPAASRAVGMANGRNPLPIVIPCHRVIGAKGALVGYSGGMDRKQRLLELERRSGNVVLPGADTAGTSPRLSA